MITTTLKWFQLKVSRGHTSLQSKQLGSAPGSCMLPKHALPSLWPRTRKHADFFVMVLAAMHPIHNSAVLAQVPIVHDKTAVLTKTAAAHIHMAQRGPPQAS
jgi:hypothetical protein